MYHTISDVPNTLQWENKPNHFRNIFSTTNRNSIFEINKLIHCNGYLYLQCYNKFTYQIQKGSPKIYDYLGQKEIISFVVAFIN